MFYSQIAKFTTNYWLRHCHPINLCLHIIGIPLTLWGFISLIKLQFLTGLVELLIGFGLQFIGHLIQGSEMGEIYLANKFWQNWKNKL